MKVIHFLKKGRETITFRVPMIKNPGDNQNYKKGVNAVGDHTDGQTTSKRSLASSPESVSR